MMRLRMKVWTDSNTGMRYLVPIGVVTERTGSKMMAYAMTDTYTRIIRISLEEWNGLPFFHFKEDGECNLEERPKRPFDYIMGD